MGLKTAVHGKESARDVCLPAVRMLLIRFLQAKKLVMKQFLRCVDSPVLVIERFVLMEIHVRPVLDKSGAIAVAVRCVNRVKRISSHAVASVV